MAIINRLSNIVKSEFATDNISEDTNYELAMEELSDELGIDDLKDEPSSNSIGGKVLSGIKYVSGVHAYEEREKALAKDKRAKAIIEDTEALAKEKHKHLKNVLDRFEKKRLGSLRNTVGVFLNYLDRMNQHYIEKDYILNSLKIIRINESELNEMKQVDMNASQVLNTLAKSGGLAALALAGTPYLVTSAVTAIGTASTGTAISALSGAAAHSAVMAWLGGGSLAAGGGGMAAGATVMAGITFGATAGVAALAAGSMVSAFYSKKHTESEENLASVREWSAELKRTCVYMDAIENRVNELESITKRLYTRTVAVLQQLEPMIDSFDPRVPAQARIFQQCAILVKSMSTLVQTPILDVSGEINPQSVSIMAETEKVLNTQL